MQKGMPKIMPKIMMDEWRQLGLRAGEKILIYGIGNVGRQDDGLGIRLIEKLEQVRLPSFVSLEANYQLNVEDALLMSSYDVVLFVDASAESGAETPFSVRAVQPVADLAFSTHAMSMGGVLSLCEELYGRSPRTFVLALPGHQWGISEEMSIPAKESLEKAFQVLSRKFVEAHA